MERYFITEFGNDIRFETDFGLIVLSNGRFRASVHIPEDYQNKVEGLCVNYDGDMTNDLFTSNGQPVSPDDWRLRYALIGESWKVDDPEFPEYALFQ